MGEDILVSIVCITYNHEKYIEKAIESFLMQETTFNFEILIHDDASTDKTAEIIKKYEEKYPNLIKVIYQKENQYSKGVRVSQILYKKAKGKYIAICEGDDYWIDSHKLQKQFDYMEKNPKCGLCFHSVKVLDNYTGKITGIIAPYRENRLVQTDNVILGEGGFIGTNSIFCRAFLLKEMPKFYKICSVGDYPIQILTSCNEYAYFIKDAMSIYRVNVEGSWTNNSKKGSYDIYVEKSIHLNENLIEMLVEFNNYSKKKYENSVNKMIKKIKFRNLLLKKDIKKLKTAEYIDMYKNISKLGRLKLNIKYYFPFIEKLYFYIKRK